MSGLASVKPRAPEEKESGGSLGRPGLPRPLSRLLAALAFVGLVTVLYIASTHAYPGDSDGATVILQGQAMSAGHLTLHGWSLSFDSFWSVDAVFYAIAVAIAGVRPSLLFVVPAVISAAVVFVGAALARENRRGASGVAAAVTVAGLLGLPSLVLSVFFLRGPLHVGTALWCLVAFWGLRRGRWGWGWVLAVVFLAAGLLGDLQAGAIGLIPASVAGLAAMARQRDWRGGAASVSAAAASVVLALLVRGLLTAVGGFTVATVHSRATRAQMAANVHHALPWVAHLLGVGSTGFGYGGVPVPLELLRVVSVLAVAAGVIAAALRLVHGVVVGGPEGRSGDSSWRLDDLLLLGFVADIGLFVYLSVSNDRAYLRYLTTAVIFGAVLAGRFVGWIAETVTTVSVRRVGATFGIVAVAAFAASLGFNVVQPRPARPYASLATFLQAKHLHSGLGDYWSASITTVASRNHVQVRPVVATPQGRLQRYDKQSDAAWYSPRQRFQFVVFDTAVPVGGVDRATATKTFGLPARTYRVGTYQVMVWNHPLLLRIHQRIAPLQQIGLSSSGMATR